MKRWHGSTSHDGRRPLWMLLLVATLGLGGCVSASSAPQDNLCRLVAPITFDRRSVDARLAADLDRLNGTWVCVCEGDCP